MIGLFKKNEGIVRYEFSIITGMSFMEFIPPLPRPTHPYLHKSKKKKHKI